MNESPAPGTEVNPSTWTGRAGVASVTCLAVIAQHGPDPAVGVAGDDGVADVQGAALYQDGRNRAAATVEVCLDRNALGVHRRIRAQVQRRVSGQQNGLEQPVDIDARLRRDLHEHGLAAIFLGDQPVFGQLLPDLVRVGAFLVDLVDRHHDRHIRGLRVVDRLDGLRHHAVVRRDHQHHDVRGLRTAGPHRRERLVTRGVDEGDQPFLIVQVGRHLVGTDVLGDPTGFLVHHVGVPDGIQQLCLAMIDVTHDSDNRRPDDEIALVALVLAIAEVEAVEQLTVLVVRGDDLNLVAHLGAEQFQYVVRHRLGGRDHLTEVEQRLHHRGRVGIDLVGEVGQRGAAGQPDRRPVAARQRHAADRRSLHVVEFLTALLLGLATLAGRSALAPEGAGCATATATAATRTSTSTTG